MRLLRLLGGITLAALFCLSLPGASMPPELAEALKGFRAEGTRGWAFTQTTRGSTKSLVERFDPRKHEFERWTLLQKDDRAPTADEIETYNEMQTRRTRGETAPNVKDQIVPDSAELVSDDGVRGTWRFRLNPTDKDDSSAAHMKAAFTLHRPSRTIERVELASFEPFQPVFGVRIQEARTVMEYSLPENDRPTLLQRIEVRLRGRAWLIKSLDDDLSVTYSDHEFAGKKPVSTQP